MDKCPICSSKLSLDELSNHIASVHGAEKVNCLYCGAGLKLTNLAAHLMDKHHGELSDHNSINPFRPIIQHSYSYQKKDPIRPLKAGDITVVVGGKYYRVLDEVKEATSFEKFCLAIPAEMGALLQELNLCGFDSLLQYLDAWKNDMRQGKGTISVSEGVLILRRIKDLDVKNSKLYKLLTRFPDLDLPRTSKKTSPYKSACPVCGKIYAIEWMAVHLNVAHLESKFHCPYCNQKAGYAGIVRHINNNHVNQLIPVYAPVQEVTEETTLIENTLAALNSELTTKTVELPASELQHIIDQPQVEAPQKHFLESPSRVPLREFRPMQRSQQPKQVRMVAEPGDRRYFLSQASLVKTERASRTHAEVLSILKSHLAAAGVSVSETFLIDAFADLAGPNIFEVKSIDRGNEKSQIRHAVAQLYEYRYLYGMKDARLWLVLSHKPVTSWVLDYLIEDRNIAVLWVQDGCLAGQSLTMFSAMIADIPQ